MTTSLEGGADLDLVLKLEALAGRPERGRWLRAVEGSGDLLVESDRSRRAGGRFHAALSFPVLYASEDTPEMREQIKGWPSLSAGSFRVSLDRVLDLTEKGVLEAFAPAGLDDIRFTRRLGAAARSAGFQGIVYARLLCADGKNLAIFADRLPAKALGPVRMETPKA